MKKEINVNGHQLAYHISGNGQPVMLVHGFGEDASVWDLQVAVLEKQYSVIVPELPGTGDSAFIETAGLETYAESLLQIINAEGIDQLVMIGHSMGGYITLAFEAAYPGKLSGLGLFHSSAYADDEAKMETRRKAISFMQQNGVNEFLKTAIPGLFAQPEGNTDVARLMEKGQAFKVESLVQYYEAMMARPDRTGVLESFDGPVLFVMGAHDKAVPMQHGLEQSHIPGKSYIHILRESGHMGMLEETEKATGILEEFLQMTIFR